MRRLLAVLAEAVSLAGDKLFIHGAPLKRIDVPQLPWPASIGIALSFTADLDEAGEQHELQFRVVGPAEDAVVLTAPPFPLGLPARHEVPADFERINALAAIGLGLVGFSYEGWHHVELSLDSASLTTLDLRVVLAPALRDQMIFSEAQREGNDDAATAD